MILIFDWHWLSVTPHSVAAWPTVKCDASVRLSEPHSVAAWPTVTLSFTQSPVGRRLLTWHWYCQTSVSDLVPSPLGRPWLGLALTIQALFLCQRNFDNALARGEYKLCLKFCVIIIYNIMAQSVEWRRYRGMQIETDRLNNMSSLCRPDHSNIDSYHNFEGKCT